MICVGPVGTSPRPWRQRELIFRKFIVSPNAHALHRGKRNFAPRDFGQKGRPLEPGDRQITLGDSTSHRQPAELSGFFQPAVVLPIRGDWLVADTVPMNQSA